MDTIRTYDIYDDISVCAREHAAGLCLHVRRMLHTLCVKQGWQGDGSKEIFLITRQNHYKSRINNSGMRLCGILLRTIHTTTTNLTTPVDDNTYTTTHTFMHFEEVQRMNLGRFLMNTAGSGCGGKLLGERVYAITSLLAAISVRE